jgi:hypothetical protein
MFMTKALRLVETRSHRARRAIRSPSGGLEVFWSFRVALATRDGGSESDPAR